VNALGRMAIELAGSASAIRCARAFALQPLSRMKVSSKAAHRFQRTQGLPKESCRVCGLPYRQQSPHHDFLARMELRPRGQQQLWKFTVKGKIAAKASGLTPASSHVILPGAASVVEVLTDKTSEPQIVAVIHHGLLGEGHLLSGVAPSIAKIAVLRRGSRKRRIESAYAMEQSGRHRHVVRSKEGRAFGAPVVVRVHAIENHLAGDGEMIVDEAVNDRAADHLIGIALQPSAQCFQPGVRDPAIIIGEGDEAPARRLRADIPRRCRSAVGGPQEDHSVGTLKRSHDIVQRNRTAVIDYDGFELIGREIEPS
jgi:hypothetical protein